MKKFLVALLALVMMFALAVPVFAEDVENVTGDTKADIKANYQAGQVEKIETVYLVNVTWKVESTLTFTEGNTTYTWNTTDTRYEKETEEDGWDGNATVAITVTNKSNADITAKATWASAEGITANCAFGTTDTLTVDSADKSTDIDSDELQGEPVDGTINATVTVSDGSIAQNDAVVGTVTLSISKVS